LPAPGLLEGITRSAFAGRLPFAEAVVAQIAELACWPASTTWTWVPWVCSTL
jgi:hypothetical protein